MWIDAICINQDNVSGKNNQVRQMNRIYQSVELVFVWLGQADAYTEKALSLVTSFEADVESGRRDKAVLDSFTSSTDADQWVALAGLLGREWWSRAWMFQQVVVARVVEIHCGSYDCAWDVFTVFASAILRQGEQWVPLVSPPGIAPEKSILDMSCTASSRLPTIYPRVSVYIV